MKGIPVAASRLAVREFQKKHRVAVLTLLFTDVVGSMKLKAELGDAAAVTILQAHHQLVRSLMAAFPEAEEIDTAGDSFFMVFSRPSDAVRFALTLQKSLREFSLARNRKISDRIGINLGEIIIDETTGKDLYGIQVDSTARVMSAAEGDQILMTRSTFDNARQVLKGQDLPGIAALQWLNYGSYTLKGIEDPLEICEVGEIGCAPLRAPENSEKVRRMGQSGEEFVLGWRPAVDEKVPGTHWILQEKLGEGGFGEVWVASHELLGEQRLFKFCFRAEHVRSLKREAALFKLLKSKLGSHPNIIPVVDVCFDEAPYYVVFEYVKGQDLRKCFTLGGDSISTQTKLDLLAEVADALHAAHHCGIVHRDVKPTNILIASTDGRGMKAYLTDFGIGQITSSSEPSARVQGQQLGQTVSIEKDNDSGTHLYMAPEIWSGEAATPQSDIYALGVVLFQVLIQDFQKPVPADWKDLISDPILVEDLERCLAGNPQKRFQSAALLSSSIRAFTQRKQELLLRQQEAKQRERAAYRLGIFRTALVGGTVAIILLALVAFSYLKHHQALRALARESAARREAEIAAGQERKARRIEFSSMLHVLFVELSKINHEKIKNIPLQFAEKGDFLISLQRSPAAKETASAIFYTSRYLDLLIFLAHALAIEKERPGFLKNALQSIQSKDDFEIPDLYRSENWTEDVLDSQANAFNSLAAFSLALELEFYDQGLTSKYRDASGKKQIADLANAQEWQKGFTNAVNDMAKTEIDLEPWKRIALALADSTPRPAWANLFAHPAPTPNSE